MISKNMFNNGCGKVAYEESVKVLGSGGIQNPLKAIDQPQFNTASSFVSQSSTTKPQNNKGKILNLLNIVENVQKSNFKTTQNRENSATSDKAPNSSILQLKSRNRGIENLNAVIDTSCGRVMYQGLLENFNNTSNTRANNQDVRGNICSQISAKLNQETWQSIKTNATTNIQHQQQQNLLNDSCSIERQDFKLGKNQTKIQTCINQEKISTIKDIKKIILANEPSSCQNKIQKDKLLIKNFQQTQKQSNSQVATPKYLKFKQQIKTSQQNAASKVTQHNIQTNQVPLKKQEQIQQSNDHKIAQQRILDNSFSNKSPIEQSKGQGIVKSKVSVKSSIQKSRDINISAIQDSSMIFSQEKNKYLNKSAEDDKEEMSTTINYTITNNEASIFPDEQIKQKQCSPQNINQQQMYQPYLQNQHIIQNPYQLKTQQPNIFRANSMNPQKNNQQLTTQSKKKSDLNTTQSPTSNMNQSFQIGNHLAQHQVNGSARGASNGSNGKQVPKTKHKRQRSGGSGNQNLEIKRTDIVRNGQYIYQDDLSKTQTTTPQYQKKLLFNAGGGQKHIAKKESCHNSIKQSQKSLKRSSAHSSRSNSIKKEIISNNLHCVKRSDKENPKKTIKHNILKNNYFSTKDQANPYDGDVSSVYQQKKKKASNKNQSKSIKQIQQQQQQYPDLKTITTLDFQDDEFHPQPQPTMTTIEDQFSSTINQQLQNQNQFFQYDTFQHYPNVISNPANSIENQQLQTTTGVTGGLINAQNVQEIEQMKRELRSKDLLIQNLKERLINLEDKVNGFQKEEQRDKSQQRIKEAIMNLEKKLEQFHKERVENNLKLEEIRSHGCASSMQSSSRQSDKGMKQGNIGLISQRKGQELQSEIEELESLITIADGDDFKFQKSIRTPVFEDLDKCVDNEDADFKILAQDGDILSDGQQDNSCLMMLEKEWQEQQNLLNQNPLEATNPIMNQNIVFFLNDEENDEELAQAVQGKEKFIKTQKIEFKSKGIDHSAENTQNLSNLLLKDLQSTPLVPYSDVNDGQNQQTAQNCFSKHQRNGSFSKTLGKTSLLNKIRTAMNKQGEIRKLQLHFPDNQGGNLQLKKNTPRRFIVKRSQERQQPLPTNFLQQNQQPSIINKEKITMIVNPGKEDIETKDEQFLKQMVSQKEKVVNNQKDAIKKERELSLKLRQAIQKLNFKQNIVQKQQNQKQQMLEQNQ